MFKSVFTRYISAFMLLILISFMLLALIMSSVITNYAYEAKQELILHTAEITIHSINVYMNMLCCDFNTLMTDYNGYLKSTLQIQAEKSETVIFITDTTGKILVSGLPDGDTEYFRADVPESVMNDIIKGVDIYSFSTLGGVFEKKHLNSVYLMEKKNSSAQNAESEIAGAFFICSPSLAKTGITEQMTKTIIISMLWLFLIALIAIYFLSEKITSPIKEMSRAAKQFAQGKFDVRVPVKGEDEIAELAVAFNNMANSLERNEELRKNFLANVSHDLRTPMTSISGFIDGILNGYIPQEKQSYYLNIVQAEVKRLSRLVSSLLDISRMQAGERKFNKSAFDICELARQILISMEKKIDEKNLDVVFDCDSDKMTVFADPDAIHQVVYNLCDNAVKFSKPGGQLSLNIHEKDKKVFFSVKNTGIGIPPEDLPFVFDRFFKSDKSRGLDKTGVGLGLYIVKTILDSHGEEIWVKSEYGEYCEFVFTLSRVHESKAQNIN
ncbi:MAG: HAMP domain-containing sensor histidine kinase [Oscillospiraceae bacterium]|nr:HAMP domain-containing sensor histidine kinase [Oscillospiraceae bacterium]